MLTRAALGCVNHLLADATWARSRLKVFSGQIVRLSFGSLLVPVAISAEGLLVSADRDAGAAVSIALPADAPWRTLTDRSALLATARIAGSADLAETLSFIFRNLRWDVEDDLSRLIGDVAARRAVLGGKQFVQWQFQKARNLALNFSEYLTEENSGIARRADVGQFCTAVASMRDDCARLEMRLQQFETR